MRQLLMKHSKKRLLVVALSAIAVFLLPERALSDVNYRLYVGGMFYPGMIKKADSQSLKIERDNAFDVQAGLHLQIGVSKTIPLFLETGLGFRYSYNFFGYSEKFDKKKFEAGHYNWDYPRSGGNDESLQVPLKVGYRLELNEKNSFDFSFGPYFESRLDGGPSVMFDVGLGATATFKHRCMSFGLDWQNPVFLNGAKNYYRNPINLVIGINFHIGRKAWGKIGNAALILGQAAGSFAESYAALQQQYGGYESGYNDMADRHSSSSLSSGGKSAGTSSSSANNDLATKQSFDADNRTYARYDSMLAKHFAKSPQASRSEVEQWQSAMKRIREKWDNRGYRFRITKTRNEDRAWNNF